jgi:hypothetical protein
MRCEDVIASGLWAWPAICLCWPGKPTLQESISDQRANNEFHVIVRLVAPTAATFKIRRATPRLRRIASRAFGRTRHPVIASKPPQSSRCQFDAWPDSGPILAAQSARCSGRDTARTTPRKDAGRHRAARLGLVLLPCLLPHVISTFCSDSAE